MTTRAAWIVLTAAAVAVTFSDASPAVRITVYALAAGTLAAKIGSEAWIRHDRRKHP